MRTGNWLLVGLLVLGVAACSSGIRRDQAVPAGKIGDGRVASVKLYLSSEAEKLRADNLTFNPDALQDMIQRTLQARSLLVAESPQRIEVEVTSFRARGTFAAIMVGVFAGTDNVTGNVHVLDKGGKLLRKFEVTASYGLGGLGGGQDTTRMNWLYEEFAKHTANELTGEAK